MVAVGGFALVVALCGGLISNGLDIFNGIDLTILYNWLPVDITGVITICITFLLFWALFGILRRIISMFT